MTSPPPPTVSIRRRAGVALKWLLFLLVVGFVVRQAVKLWDQPEFGQIVISPLWLLAAIPATVLGWLPSAGYWRYLMATLGERVRWRDAARAYYCGHLGKYVPGKATALLIRAGLLQGRGASLGTATLTSTFEVLVTFAAAIFIGVCLLPWIVDREEAKRLFGIEMPATVEFHWSMTVVALLVAIAGLHVASRAFTRLVLWKRRPPLQASPVQSPAIHATGVQPLVEQPSPVVLPCPALASSTGWFLLLVAGWWVQGLSLGLAVRAVSGAAFAWDQWPLWTAAMALSSVLGFVAVFAPGGLVVREGLIFSILAPHIGGREAVVVAALLRVAGLAGEILTGGILYYAITPNAAENETFARSET